MMNNIVYTAEHFDEICALLNVVCPLCSRKVFSPFDKLFVSAYGKCVDCATPEELEVLGENIFILLM